MSGPRLNVVSRLIDSSGLGLAVTHISSTGESHTFIDQDVTTTGNPTFNDLTLTGDLTVNGTSTVISTEILQITDNIIVLNKDQTGIPSTALLSGIEVERGDSVNYQFVFAELTGTVEDTFRIGEVGSTQAVGTREDTPLSNGIMIWNNTQSRMDAVSSIVLDITFTGSNSTSVSTGAIKTTGGIGITQDMYIGGSINLLGSGSSGSIDVDGSENLNIAPGSGGDIFFTSGAVSIADTTQATDKDTGALIVDGGAGFEKNVYIGGNLEVTGTIDLGAVSIGGTGITIDVDSDSALLVRKDGDSGDLFRINTDNLSVAITDAFENGAGTNLGTTGTDAFGSAATDEELFSADNDTVEIGLASPFTRIVLTLSTVASASIIPTFEFSDGGGGWTDFTGSVTDGTSGFTADGTISWQHSGVVGWATDTINGVSGRYWVRITRTEAAAITAPIEDTILLGVTEGIVTIGETGDTATDAARLVFADSVLSNRKIVLQGDSNENEHQFVGFGVNTGVLRYQVDDTTTDHVWYSATSAGASQELFRIDGDQTVTSKSTFLVDNTATDALRVRKLAGADIFNVNTSGEIVTVGGQVIVDEDDAAALLVRKNGGGDDVLTVDTVSGTVRAREDTASGDSAVLQLVNLDDNVASSVSMEFRLNDDGAGESVYAAVGGGVQVNSAGVEDGSLIFSVADNGGVVQKLKISGDTNISLFDSKLSVNITSADAFLVETDGGTDVFAIDTSSGITKVFSSTSSTSTTSGAFQVVGGGAFGENLYVGGNVSISGNLNVLGTETIVNTATLEVDDNLVLINASPGTIGEDAGVVIRRHQFAVNDGTGDVVNSTNGEFVGINVLAAGSSATTITLEDDATLQAVSTLNEITNSTTLFTGQLDFFAGWWLRVTTKGAGGEAVGAVRRIKSNTASVSPICTIYDTSDGGNDGLDFVTTPDGDNVVNLYSCPYASSVYNESRDEWMLSHTSLDPATGGQVSLQAYSNVHVGNVLIQGNVIGVGDNDTNMTVTGGENSGDSLVLRSTSHATKGQVYIDESTASTSSVTGALRVGGGVGIAGRTSIGDQLHVGSTGTAVEVNFQGRTHIRGSGNTNQFSVIDSSQSELITVNVNSRTTGGPDNTGSLLEISPGSYEDTVTATSSSASGPHIFNQFTVPTLTATNASVTTAEAATVRINGSPISGTNQTITESYALWVDSGLVRLDGVLDVQDTTEASAVGTAAVTLDGGLSVAKNIYTGGDLYVTGASGSDRSLNLLTGTETRWSLKANSTADPDDTTDAGSDFEIVRLSDTGASVVAMRSTRSTGDIEIFSTSASTSSITGALQLNGGLGIFEATDATDSTNGGSATIAGGLAVAKKAFIGTDLVVGGNSAFGDSIGFDSRVTLGLANDNTGSSGILSQLRTSSGAATIHTATGTITRSAGIHVSPLTFDVSNLAMNSINSSGIFVETHDIDDPSGLSSGTIVTAASVHIAGAPTNNSGTAITNGPYALYIDDPSATSRVTGNLEVDGDLTVTGAFTGANTTPVVTDLSFTIDEVSDTTELVRTTAAHGLAVGDIIYIEGLNTTPNINGTVYVKTVPDTTHFSVSLTDGGAEVNITSVVDQDGTVYDTGNNAGLGGFGPRVNITGAITTVQARTIRIGDEVTFRGGFRFTPTAGSLETSFEIKVPILTTDFVNVYDAVCAHNSWYDDTDPESLENITIVAVPLDDQSRATTRLLVKCTSVDTSTHTIQVTATYTV